MFPYLRLLSLSLVLGLPLAGCDTDVPEDKPSNSDADADSDADSDTDADEGPAADEDDDGFTVDDGDCDDTDDSVHPDADELCDGIDNNCDDSIDNDATDATEWFADVDGDDYGNPDASEWACDQPESHVADAADCDDTNDAIHPAADELCDLSDNDCDGLIDTEDDTLGDGYLAYTDVDGDGFGAPDTETTACILEDDQTMIGADCDDTNSLVNPDAFEVCDGIDNDCDTLVDDEDDDRVGASTFYADVDGDGYGDVGSTTLACWGPAGFVTDDNDCDDSDPEVSPAGTDYCGDDVDSNCSGDESDCYDLSINEVHDMIVCDGEPGPLRVSGTRFDISYNENGLWNDPDTEMGLQIASDGTDWVDVTDPGLPYAVTMYGHTIDPDGDDSWDTLMYSDGGGGDLDDLVPDCANLVEVGDVIGVIHEYTLDHTHILKTELWKRDEQIMRVWYEVTNISDTVIGWPAINTLWDPDIDYDLHGATATTFGLTSDSRYLTAFGPDSGWSLSVGICDNVGNVRGWEWPSGSGTTDPPSYETACDPSGLTDDLLMGWTSGDFYLDAGEAWEDGFIVTTSTGSWDALGAFLAYSTVGPDLCEVDEADWSDDTMTTLTCDSVSLPDLPDLPDSPEF
jgi:hypothetical protein